MVYGLPQAFGLRNDEGGQGAVFTNSSLRGFEKAVAISLWQPLHPTHTVIVIIEPSLRKSLYQNHTVIATRETLLRGPKTCGNSLSLTYYNKYYKLFILTLYGKILHLKCINNFLYYEIYKNAWLRK